VRLVTEPYLAQVSRWPKAGRHILAQFDENSAVVYQAFRPAIGHFAASHGYFGGEFRRGRMSWIKPNFLWMMHRSGWGAQADQEVILAVWVKRSAFDEILAAAVHSSFVPEVYGNETDWKQAVKQSSVRLQWDTDYDPWDAKVERRAIQLGLRGDFLSSYARDWIVNIEDISEFVRQQRQNRQAGIADLLTPFESVYPVDNPYIAKKLGLSVPY
jgi:hypothetical protein